MEIVHNWLKDYIGETLPSVTELDDLLTYHSYEVEEILKRAGETVLDIDVLPNRSSDSLCHRGVAREVATLLGVSLVHDPLVTKPELPATDKIRINIADSATCPRFSLTFISGIEVKESPSWLKTRLEALGQRSINNIVDATNYVMFALGQPMHAYDADKFPLCDGVWQMDVRLAKEGETVSLLAEAGSNEDRVVELLGDELLIVDGSSNTPVGLAGIKGGRFAELTTDTKNILVEAAHFDPVTIRKTARRLGILTDASKRFENEPSRELPLYAQAEISALIKDIAGGTCEGIKDVYLEPWQPVSTAVRVEKVNTLLGLSLSADEVKAILLRIGATVEMDSDGVFLVTAPWERTDLTIEADYIEEVGRIHGLSKVESVVPEAVPLQEVNKRQYYSELVRHALLAAGFSEVITSSFLKKGTIQLQNALASDKSFVRDTIKKNITAVLDANFAHTDLLGIQDVRVFEIGTVFYKIETGVGERVVLTIGARTKGNGYNPKDDTVVEEATQVVDDTLGTALAWERSKGVAEVNLSEVLSTLPVPSAYMPFERRPAMTFKRPSAYPAVARDIALWVAGSAGADEVAEKLVIAAGPLLVRHDLFDTFTKEDRTSYAFRLVFQSAEKTLTDIEVNAVMEDVYQAANANGWEVR